MIFLRIVPLKRAFFPFKTCFDAFDALQPSLLCSNKLIVTIIRITIIKFTTYLNLFKDN